MTNKKNKYYEAIDIMKYDAPFIMHYDILTNRKGHHLTLHYHEKIEFLYIVKGKGRFEISGKRYEVASGDLVVINSNEYHYGISLTHTLEYYCLIVDTLLFTSLHQDGTDTKYIKPIYENHLFFENYIHPNRELKTCLDNLIDEFIKKEIGYELMIKSSIFKLITLLIRSHISRTITKEDFIKQTSNQAIINESLKYILANFDKPITVLELSKTANLSKYYYHHLFKEVTNQSVISYINQLRIQKASYLLRETDLSISEIGYQCGFNDPNYFSRQFKNSKAVSPKEYRLKNKQIN